MQEINGELSPYKLENQNNLSKTGWKMMPHVIPELQKSRNIEASISNFFPLPNLSWLPLG